MKESGAEIRFLDLEAKRERLEPRRVAAPALGIHPQHLYSVEKGYTSPSLLLALRCVRRYGPLHLISRETGDVFLLQRLDRPPGLRGEENREGN